MLRESRWYSVQILKEWLDDIPQQFQGKKNIAILIGAFAKQMEEIQQVFEDINTKTTLEEAVGQNLDYVGNIATLSRKDAHIIMGGDFNAELTDDVYRKVILWKLIKNTCDCTYEDIMGSMSLLWDTENIQYVEDPARPATILLKMPTIDIDGIDSSIGRVLSIKPGGVAIIYTIGYMLALCMTAFEKVEVPEMEIRFEVPFPCKMLSETSEDGIDIGVIEMSQTEQFVDVGLTKKRNAWYLNGEYNLDGERLLNSEVYEETIEEV